jgi:hypothetical protein
MSLPVTIQVSEEIHNPCLLNGQVNEMKTATLENNIEGLFSRLHRASSGSSEP